MKYSPLFDQFDPLGEIRNQSYFDDEIQGVVKRKATIEDLMPDDEKATLLRSLANAGASGLSTAGYILDTPGAFVRGMLAGKPLSVFGNSEDRVSGRDLLRSYGLAGQQDNWWNFGGGIAAEMATDPLSFLSLGLLGQGARTAGGQVLKRAGYLDDIKHLANQAGTTPRRFMRDNSIDSVVAALPTTLKRSAARERLRDAAEGAGYVLSPDMLKGPLAKTSYFKLPFARESSGQAIDLFGKYAGDKLAGAADDVGGFLRNNPYTGPLVRGASAAFDPRVMDMTDGAMQDEARLLNYRDRQGQSNVRRIMALKEYDVMMELAKGPVPIHDSRFANALRNEIEGWGEYNTLPDGSLTPGGQALAGPKAQAYLDFVRSKLRAGNKQAQRMGIPQTEFVSDVGTQYFPRQRLAFDNPLLEASKGGWFRKAKPAPVGSTGSRRSYTDVYGGSGMLDRLATDGQLRTRLQAAAPADTEQVLRDWFVQHGVEHPHAQGMELFNNGAATGIVTDTAKQYQDLGAMLREADPQHVSRQAGYYENPINTFRSYMKERATAASNAQALPEILRPYVTDTAAINTVGGNTYGVRESLGMLGYDVNSVNGLQHWEHHLKAKFAKQLGIPVDDIANYSIPKRVVDAWAKATTRGDPLEVASSLGQAYKNFTKSFKTVALASPKRAVRDLYSGAIAAQTQDAFAPLDWHAGGQMRRGQYSPLIERLRTAPGYRQLATDEDRLRKFLVGSAEAGVGASNMGDEIAGASRSSMQSLFPGQVPANRPQFALGGRNSYGIPNILNPFAVANGGANPNPYFEAMNLLGETTDSMNRYGTYLNSVRKGYAPSAARQLTDLTQVDYTPGAFTNFERRYLKPHIPFYSYNKGILPLIAENAIHRPGGSQSQIIRALTRGTEPSEEQFVPEYLRQTASLALPDALGSGNPNIKRFLTNIDVPFEGPLNLFSPGIGNSASATVVDSARKTLQNLAGQLNPLIKLPIEWATNRSFHNNRQLSDLYSMLEQPLPMSYKPLGRLAEHVLQAVPGGTRTLGLVRQAVDDRLSPTAKLSKFLVNSLSGVKLQDVDQEKTMRLAARDTLNALLESTPGVRTYENLHVPADVFSAMSPKEQRLYLLYRVIQSEAGRRARDKKKAALDPLQILKAVGGR